MLRRALLTVVVLSYLICVLLLSGVQKDDLDVNTLRKLQQRNVNIHDANNEELHRDCLRNNSVTIAKEAETIKMLLSTTTIQLPVKELNKNSEDNIRLQNLVNMQNQNYEPEIGNDVIVTRGRRTVTTETSFVEPTILQFNNNDNNNEQIEDSVGKPKLQNVVNFWQNLVMRNKKNTTNNSIIKISSDNNNLSTDTTKTFSSIPKKTQTEVQPVNSKVRIDNDLENTNIVEGGYLNNMLSEYISKQTTTLDRSTTTEKSYELGTEKVLTDDDTDIFNYLLNNNKESTETHNINAHLSKYSYEINFSRGPHKKIQYNKNRHNSFEDDELKNIFMGDFEDLESNNDYAGDKPSTKLLYISRNIKNGKHGGQRPNDIQSIMKPRNSELIYNNERSTSTLPSAVIEKIAENVKTLILKDLHSEIGKVNKTKSQTASTISSETTTEITSTTLKLVTEKKLESSHVIEKIMELLQKYRNDNDSSVSYTTEQNSKINERHRTPKVVFPPLLPPIDNYAMKPAKYLPHLNFPNKVEHLTKKIARSQLRNPKRKPFNPIRNLPPAVNSVDTANNFRTRPITIQTNLNEIPPLSIPVSNPLELVSQNIITTRPYHRNIVKRKNKSRGNKNYNKLYKGIRSQKETFTPEINQKHEKNYNKDVITFRISDDSNEGNSKKEDENKIKNFNSDTNDAYRYRFRSRDNIQRFHEKLEKFHPNTDNEDAEKDDCCEDEIFTREQRPLNIVNRRDDTSFKNLIKTQQRVTNMLERMLARAKGEQPLSVETT